MSGKDVKIFTSDDDSKVQNFPKHSLLLTISYGSSSFKKSLKSNRTGVILRSTHNINILIDIRPRPGLPNKV